MKKQNKNKNPQKWKKPTTTTKTSLYIYENAWSQAGALYSSMVVLKTKCVLLLKNQKHSEILVHTTNGCHKRTAQYW